MSQEQWMQVSRVLDFIMKQPTKETKEPKHEVKRKPKQAKPKLKGEQLRMF